jgi:hypothetical protein
MQLYTYNFVHNGVLNLDIGHIPSCSRSTFFGLKYADRDLGLIGIVTKNVQIQTKLHSKECTSSVLLLLLLLLLRTTNLIKVDEMELFHSSADYVRDFNEYH